MSSPDESSSASDAGRGQENDGSREETSRESSRGGSEPKQDRPRDDRPRYNDRGGDSRSYRPREDRPRDDRPRYNDRGGDSRSYRPRDDRPRDDRPRYNDRGGDSRSYRPREDRPRDDRPRYNDRGGDSRSYRPRDDRPRDDRPRYNDRGSNDFKGAGREDETSYEAVADKKNPAASMPRSIREISGPRRRVNIMTAGSAEMPKSVGRSIKKRSVQVDFPLPPRTVPLARRTLDLAVDAYERDRFDEALRYLRKLESMAPDVPEVLELLGLTYYRVERFPSALRILRKFVKLTEDVSQAAVLMDCARAMGNAVEVERWWRVLREASPSKEAVTEGRVVYAAFLADSDRIGEAISLMEGALVHDHAPEKLPALRQKYLLATLYERAGNVAQARELYTQLVRFDATLYDVPERLAGLN